MCKFPFHVNCLQIITCVFVVLVLHNGVYGQHVVLNEIMASNNSTITDEDGDYEDWIEIYNHGNNPINLEGYGLSDDYDLPFRWTFPDISIQPGSFLVIWASGKDREEPGGELHTNFAISAAGEEVILTRPDSTRIDELPPTNIPSDISIGRSPDGTGQWFFFDEPTPGSSNSTEPVQNLSGKAVFSHNPGFYTSAFTLELSHPEDGVTLYYTLDGSTPTTASQIYGEPISIYNRTSEPNGISTIPTNNLDTWRRFRSPSGLINKGNVVRVLAVKNGHLPSYTTGSFFVFPEGSDAHSLPVISITTDHDNLFGHERGIYIPGANFIKDDHDTGNYYQRGIEWEREATFEFFDENGALQVAQNVGLRIHGGFSRRWIQKTFRVYARSEYGESRINYRIFPDQEYNSYNRLLLRNSGNDQGLTMFRDAAAHRIVQHLNFDTQAYRPAVVYINGEYWGFKNIRERFDRHYLERVYGIDPGNIDLLTGPGLVQEGNNQHYNSVLKFLGEKNLSNDTNYAEAARLIDIDNFLDYYSAQIYFVNTDWPQNNIDFWRLRTSFDADAPRGHDGRWRWLFYDIDFTFGLSQPESFNMLHHVTQKLNFEEKEWPNFVLRNLLQNEAFKHDFINRMADHLNTAFLPERVLSIIDDIKSTIEPEIPRFITRWYYPRSMSHWEEFISPAIQFAKNRPQHLRENIISHFNLQSTAEITLRVKNKTMGSLQVNSIHISPDTPGISNDPYPWRGTYFSGVPITVKPIPESTFQFSHWVVDGEEIYQHELKILPDTADNITAHFVEIALETIKPHTLSEQYYHFAEWNEDEPVASFPQSMAFVYMDEVEPGLDASVAGITQGAYNLNSRTRINGLGDDGFSFINTTNLDGNPGYPGRQLGGAVLKLDTRDIFGAEVSWEAGTVEPNSRIYNLRLQYRVGSEGEFSDLTGSNGNPVEYLGNKEAGHSEFIGPVSLPDNAIGQPVVELLWRYYFTGEQVDPESNQRSELNISTIHVAAVPENPEPLAYDLNSGAYEFTRWPADTTAGAAPPSMAFAYMDLAEPGLDASVLGFTSGKFNLETRTRVNGLGDDGFSFINTDNLEGNPGYPGRRLGGAVLALNTEKQGSIEVNWTAGTVLPNSRIYNIRLQYRTSPDEPFRDVTDRDGNPVEYPRNAFEGHALKIDPVILPADAENKPYVQLFWRYYFTGEREDEDSGQRSQLNISHIRVSSQLLLGTEPGTPQEFRLFQNYPNPFYPQTTIRYDLPSTQNVRIDLYTITGRHVATLEEKQATAGRHSVQVNVSSLASGIYLYRFVSENYSESGRMSVIK